jgi:predicted dehydrogenase
MKGQVITMEEQLGLAVLGCGYWGINYVRVFNELPGTRVISVCDKRADRLAEVAQRFPGVAVTTDNTEALNQEGVRAAVVATEATSHYDVARACLAAGKHVLIEKPLTTVAADAARLVDLAAVAGRTLMVGHTFLYNPAVRVVKEYIERGDVGRIYYLYAARTNLGPIRHDVNALWDLAPHDIAIFNYWLGRTPLWVSAVGTRLLHNSGEDVGFITLGYPDNILGHIHVSWADPYKVREVVVVGSEQRILFNDLNPLEPVRVFEKGVAVADDEPTGFGEHHLRMRDGAIISPKVEISEPLKNECRHFVECVTRGGHPFTDGQAGLAVVRVLEAITRSLAHHGEPVEIEGETDHEHDSYGYQDRLLAGAVR